MAFNKFKLEKLTLEAFEDEGRKKAAKAPNKVEATFNPATLKRSYGVTWSCRQALGSSGKTASFQRAKPSELEVTLLFDGTGANEMGIFAVVRKTVGKQIDELMAVAFNYNGNIHQPNYLLLKWGEITFPCRLQHVDVTYKLFNRDGTPLRAELAMKLVSDESLEALAKKENKSSPDLTHSKRVCRGDTLPLMTREIYGTSMYYLRVARFNDLDHPQDLTPGQLLHFPPAENLPAS